MLIGVLGKLQRRGGMTQPTKLEMLNVVEWCIRSSRSSRVLNLKHIGKLQLRGAERVLKYLGQCRKKGRWGVALRKPVRHSWKKETLQNEMSKAIIGVMVHHYYNVGHWPHNGYCSQWTWVNRSSLINILLFTLVLLNALYLYLQIPTSAKLSESQQR